MARVWLGVLAMACAASAMGAVYKWVDAQGVTHYSETPPQETESRELRIHAAPPAGSQALEPAAPAPETGAPAKKATAEDRRKWCEIARENVGRLEGDKPVVELTEEAQWHMLDEEQRAKALADAKRRVKQYCAPE